MTSTAISSISECGLGFNWIAVTEGNFGTAHIEYGTYHIDAISCLDEAVELRWLVSMRIMLLASS